ncbi:MAG TPA: STAS domain-containing protein [Pseudonocardiaceae bacterium]
MLTAQGREIEVLSLAGEIDLLSFPEVSGAVDASLGRRPSHLVIEMSEVSFCSVAGFGLLAHASVVCGGRGCDLLLSGCRPAQRRLLSLMWPTVSFVHHRGLAEAFHAIAGLGVPAPRSSGTTRG